MGKSVQLQLLHSGDKCIVSVKNIQSEKSQANPSVDIGICQDVSGSMGSNVSSSDGKWGCTKVKLCQEAIKFILSKIGNNRLGLVKFDSLVSRVFPLERIHNRDSVSRSIDSIYPGSCTNLSGGLFESFKMMESGEASRVKYLLVFTDGCANEGITNLEALVKMVKTGVEKCNGLKLVVMGYGTDCNSTLLQSMVESVDGSYHQLNSAEDIPKAMGEEFGTALHTCQQNMRIKFDAATMTPLFEKKDMEEGICTVGDLLLEEERHFLFQLTDPSLLQETSVSVEYLDCTDGDTGELDIHGETSVEDPIAISDAENIISVSTATKVAADLSGEARKQVLKKCIEKLNSSVGKNSMVTQRLIKSLNEQLECCHMAQPATLRSYSNSAQRQRGGHFASMGVALMRGVSEGAVSSACSFPPTSAPAGTSAPIPADAPALYPGAGLSTARVQLDRPGLVRHHAEFKNLFQKGDVSNIDEMM